VSELRQRYVTSDAREPSDRGVAVSPPTATPADPGASPPSLDPEAFRCDVSRERDTASVRTVGELDIATAPVLSAQIASLREAGCRHLTIDLSDLRFMDSTGLRFLLECYAEARQDGFTLALLPGPPALQRVFELTGTTSHLPFVDP
jgi:stage II sporulation protein AA (anti-sigma F factor antagonist)